MCGIAGLFMAAGGAHPNSLRDAAAAMGRAIVHRGPDATGVVSDGMSYALVHQRLSILDLSENGNQPMTSADGRWLMVYNGECYNYRELREQLDREADIVWRSGNDAEVVLNAIAAWGMTRALKAANGMFALAMLNLDERALYLARDRIGKKPLYVYTDDQRVAFGSELRALMAAPDFKRTLSREGLTAYLTLGYVPESSCIFSGVHKVAPGTVERYSFGPDGALITSTVDRFWQLDEVATPASAQADVGELDQTLESILGDAVGARLVADVPVGCLLSGGVDSSLISALAVRHNAGEHRVRTFCVGFDQPEFDESRFAADVARHLGTKHTEVVLREQDALDAVADLPAIYDEPFADASQLPTYLVSRVAREHVKVVLSGDGGDELFLGYTRYARKLAQWQKVSRLPRAARAATAGVLSMMGSDGAAPGERFAGCDRRVRMAALLRSRDAAQAYLHGVSLTSATSQLLLSGGTTGMALAMFRASALDDQRNFARIDCHSYLPSDILCKVDRASMAVSLEARCPILDYRVIEHAWRYPTAAMTTELGAKAPLKRLLYRYVPRDLVDRPKRGFAVPLCSWLRGPLRDWAEALLLDDGAHSELLDPAAVAACWRRLLDGQDEYERLVWALINLRLWANKYDVAL